MPTHTRTFDIPGLVRETIGDILPMFLEMDLIKPETPLTGAPLYLDAIDVMEMTQEISQALDITVTFEQENQLNAVGITIQDAINFFTKLNAEQHPTQQ